MYKKIILASSSPRRKELLAKLGIEFEVIPPFVDEVPLKDESPADFALRVSTEKTSVRGPGSREQLRSDWRRYNCSC
ncbi:MAG TPA: Maf family protein [Thermodesulfobacteriota bacterium]|nr:Maf family protein [Thermodesulfobacteriota bacterium]